MNSMKLEITTGKLTGMCIMDNKGNILEWGKLSKKKHEEVLLSLYGMYNLFLRFLK